MDRNILLTIGVIVGALLAIGGIILLVTKKSVEPSEGSFGDFKLQGPVGVVVSIAGVALLITCISNLGDPPSGTNGAATTTSPTIVPTTTELPPVLTSTAVAPPVAASALVKFDKPRDASDLIHGANVEVSGSATGLNGRSVWVVTVNSNGGSDYYLTSDSATTTRDGSWGFTDEAVGDETDVGGTITYIALVADTDCAVALKAAVAAGGDPPRLSPRPSCVEAVGPKLPVE